MELLVAAAVNKRTKEYYLVDREIDINNLGVSRNMKTGASSDIYEFKT